MKIGMTYDLRSQYLAAGFSETESAEFDSEETVAAIETSLTQLGHQVDRIGNVRQLTARLAAGGTWDLVFNIAEGVRGMGREAQIPALLDAYDIPYTFSDPLVMSLCLHKGMTKHVIRDNGLPTPAFKVAEQATDLADLELELPFFIKPVAEGTGKGVSPSCIISDRDELLPRWRAMMDEYHQPVLIEEFLPGRELTVGILGTGSRARVLGSIEVLVRDKADRNVYSFDNKENWEQRVRYRLCDPETDPVCRKAQDVALRSWQALGCRDGGRVDLRCNGAGEPEFMEVNPLAGLRPGYSDLPIICHKAGIPYDTLIREIVESALLRVNHQ